MQKLFDLNMVEAKKIMFLKPIFEDDFPEKGMKAWLTDIVKINDCFKLYFDFSEFEEENEKYFKAEYYNENGKPCLTAKEAGLYNSKYNVYFGDTNMTEEQLNTKLEKYLKSLYFK